MTETESSSQIVGRIAEIWRYPVKSMRGESLDRAELRWTGIAGDRQFAFVRSDNRQRFPWLTGRELSELVLYRAEYANPEDPRNSGIGVTAPEGKTFDIWDPELARQLGEHAGEPVHAMQLGRGAFDQHPLSVITAKTLRDIAERTGHEADPRRFRVNIVIDETPDAPPEASWTDGTLSLGASAAVRIDELASRCAMITVHPETAQRDPGVMRVVAQEFANQVALYCAPTARGEIAVGDIVRLS